MNAATKYVVSRTLADVSAWQNSILLRGDAVESVTDLKSRSDREVSITAAPCWFGALHAAGPIDRYTLLIHPLTLGHGARLFDDPAPMTEFKLTDTTTGMIIAHYARR